MAERFSAVLSPDHPPNFHLLPGFSCQELMPDGIHLNPVSGLHYVLHVFDQTERALQLMTANADQQLVVFKESVRQNNDRVSYLENRHGGLQQQVDRRTAIDAEFSDWMINRSEEDWLTVQGLPRLSGTNDWQSNARRQVADTIKVVLHANRTNLDFEVVYVSNPFRYQPNRPNSYNVRMDSVRSAKRIRELFSGFFRHHRPVTRPPPLKGVSIRNKITPDTKIRIAILHQFGSIFKETNRGGDYKVRGFDSRPTLVTLPPKGTGGRQRTYNFIQAVTSLPPNFSDEHLTKIFQVVSEQQPGKLQSLFVVIHDDDRDRCLELVKQSRAATGIASSSAAATAATASGPSAAAVVYGSFSRSGTGMDLRDEHASVNPTQDAPPPAAVPSEHQVASEAESERSADHEKETDKSRGKDKNKEKERTKSKRQRHSSDSSDGRSRKKKSKKSKSKHRRRSPSQSSTGSSASSGSSSSRASHSKRTKSRK